MSSARRTGTRRKGCPCDGMRESAEGSGGATRTINGPCLHEWVRTDGMGRAREIRHPTRCCFRGTKAHPPRRALYEGEAAQGVRSGGLQTQSPSKDQDRGSVTRSDASIRPELPRTEDRTRHLFHASWISPRVNRGASSGFCAARLSRSLRTHFGSIRMDWTGHDGEEQLSNTWKSRCEFPGNP